ncbi:MAG: hypothetical protein A2139_08335 [Desulfobacca sp. RBG_16_60_12]|nr:MAG: hypothetical protein A2139_08335 [Desulfobacca sp. RBG_16_60_12]
MRIISAIFQAAAIIVEFGKIYKYFIKETCAIMASTRVSGFKNRNFEGFSSGIEVPKIIFDSGSQDCDIISENSSWT